MFDQILSMIKEHLGNNAAISSAIPAGQEDALHQEIANPVTNDLGHQVASQGGVGSMLSKLEAGFTSGNPSFACSAT